MTQHQDLVAADPPLVLDRCSTLMGRAWVTSGVLSEVESGRSHLLGSFQVLDAFECVTTRMGWGQVGNGVLTAGRQGFDVVGMPDGGGIDEDAAQIAMTTSHLVDTLSLVGAQMLTLLRLRLGTFDRGVVEVHAAAISRLTTMWSR